MQVKLYRKQLEDLLLSSGLKEDDIPSLWNGLKELASREKSKSHFCLLLSYWKCKLVLICARFVEENFLC